MVLIERRASPGRGRSLSGVSVPLRGLWFLSAHGPLEWEKMTDEFPSPCGDYGSYLLTTTMVMVCLSVFPSPCGDYGSYHDMKFYELPQEVQEFPSPCGDYGSYRMI